MTTERPKTCCNKCGHPYTGDEGYVGWTCTPCLTDYVLHPNADGRAVVRQERAATVRLKIKIGRLFKAAILEMMGNLVTEEIVERDVRIAPTHQEWISAEGILEVACEGGIMNASDVEVFYWDDREIVARYADTWDKITETVNERLCTARIELGHALWRHRFGSAGLRLFAGSRQWSTVASVVHYEPYNSAIVGVYFTD